MHEHCLSPLCNNLIDQRPCWGRKTAWRRTPRRFCSDRCKGDTWALRKAADLLSPFSTEKKIEISGAVSSRINQCEINTSNHREATVQNQHEFNMKTYICRSWPQLSIRVNVRFRNG